MVESELSWVASEAMGEPEPLWPASQSCADFHPARPSLGSGRTTARVLWSQDNRKRSSKNLPFEIPVLRMSDCAVEPARGGPSPVPAPFRMRPALRLRIEQPDVRTRLAMVRLTSGEIEAKGFGIGVVAVSLDSAVTASRVECLGLRLSWSSLQDHVGVTSFPSCAF